jgi:ATP-dependent 26S proteasome regulatory subunit
MSEFFSSFVFKHPAPVILAGPTGCGKTVFIQNVLEQQLIGGEIVELY